MKYKLFYFRVIQLSFLMMISLCGYGQESKLALQYFNNGEYEKASSLYKKLFEENEASEYYFNRFIDCLMGMRDYDNAEKIIQKQIKKLPKEVTLYVTYGNLLEKNNKSQEALVQYQKGIDNLPADESTVYKLANAFTNITMYDKAIETYEKGNQLFKGKISFSNSLADLYYRKGDTPKMIGAYLTSLVVEPTRLQAIESVFLTVFTEPDYDELQGQIFDKIQTEGDAIVLVELLTWQYFQRKDYTNALRQAKSLDKRLQENGSRAYQIGSQALLQKDYSAAIQAYEYITVDKGKSSPLYYEANKDLLKARRLSITDTYTYTKADLIAVESAYETTLNDMGRNSKTAQLILEFGQLEGLYLGNLPKAIQLLDSLKEMQGINKNLQAETKLQLGDFYLMTGEVWEATLLYSQVDKDFAEDPLGHEARFRNAKLSYYTGDFDWAQSQFDVLKSSTSKLIANDALDLSVFIMDNMGLDTTTIALGLYADADLLVFQNKFDEAFIKLDSISLLFPDHSLVDDEMYLKANIYHKKKNYQESEKLYKEVIEKFPEDIRADNSMYELAQMYENEMDMKEKAKELYEKLFTTYSGSIFAADARKQFRLLRGDKVVQ